MRDLRNFFEPNSANPGLDEVTRQQCETMFGVVFPESFIELFQMHNGGFVRDEDEMCLFSLHTKPYPDDGYFSIRPLNELAARGEVLDEQSLAWVAKACGDPERVFLLWTDGHMGHALDFNHQEAGRGPRVVFFDFELSVFYVAADSFGAWLDDPWADQRGTPQVDWDEADRLPLITYHQTEIQRPDGRFDYLQQNLCRDAGQLIVLRRELSQGYETLTRCSMPEPLSDAHAMIRRIQTEPHPMFGLVLQPASGGPLRWVVSKLSEYGAWENKAWEGEPSYVLFESPHRERLEALRKELIGGPAHYRWLRQEHRNDPPPPRAPVAVEKDILEKLSKLTGQELHFQLQRGLTSQQIAERALEEFDKMIAQMEDAIQRYREKAMAAGKSEDAIRGGIDLRQRAVTEARQEREQIEQYLAILQRETR